jgi:hypothetical protein
MKLQQYLNNLENKPEIKEINLAKIQQEREQVGETELLEGGELNLTAFINLEKVEIVPQFLSTSLTKIEVQGLTNLKELIWKETQPESEEDKKLWEELGISEKTAENLSKKAVVREVKRLGGLKGVKVNWGIKEEGKEGIFLNLDQKDKQGNFYPSLIFWNLARELATGPDNLPEKNPVFWKQFDKELEWVKQNVSERYFLELEQITVPSTFPTEKLNISEFFEICFYQNLEENVNQLFQETRVGQKIVDKTWLTIRQRLIELISEEVNKNPSEEELTKLKTKAIIGYDAENLEYKILVHFCQEIPFKTQLEQLITITPLKLEIEHLKSEREQLPTSENFAKLSKQNQAWENCLGDFGLGEKEQKEIKEKIDKIS